MEYFKAQTLQQASQWAEKYGQKAVLLNGGTDVIYRMDKEMFNPEVLIDIKEISELKRLNYKEKERLEIGGAITINELGKIEGIFKPFSYLMENAYKFGGSATRNRATLVGNICNKVYPMPYFGTILLVLEAYIEIYHYKTGVRTLNVEEFLSLPTEKRLIDGEIIKTLYIPYMPGTGVYVNENIKDQIPAGFSLALYRGGKINIAFGNFHQSPRRLSAWEEQIKVKGLSFLLLKNMLLSIFGNLHHGKEQYVEDFAREMMLLLEGNKAGGE
ncbi:FAD binding domain-containing protein [Irregularibacter muris]|uniref:FAD binding domain-containing protein n=1 Tax=Irregularibacter muris TaxID=1796619 RepID=A0AAE3KYX6_9FIRM|nr:FAD binding domain-containing protein [Irregularibacter muris]MCR1897781.1 FAD binding domain-containing protein [Irregularibacter muris]